MRNSQTSSLVLILWGMSASGRSSASGSVLKNAILVVRQRWIVAACLAQDGMTAWYLTASMVLDSARAAAHNRPITISKGPR